MLPTIVVLALVSFTDALNRVVPPLLESGILHMISRDGVVIIDVPGNSLTGHWHWSGSERSLLLGSHGKIW